MSPEADSPLPKWCAALLPAHIFWRYHIEDKTLVLLSPAGKSCFSDILTTLLTDLRFAATIVAADDFPRFKYFIRHLRQGKADDITFRLTSQLGQWHTGRMAAHVLLNNPSLVYGYFLDITELIASSPVSREPSKPGLPYQEETGGSVEKLTDSSPADLSQTMNDLCRLQQRRESSLFDALALIRFDEDQVPKRWLSAGFEGEQPEKDEIDHLVMYLKTKLDKADSGPLIVNNTVGSHLPLDWAIFVRNGMISYWIEPLIQRRRLKGAIIFASKQAWRYHPDLRSQLFSTMESLKRFV